METIWRDKQSIDDSKKSLEEEKHKLNKDVETRGKEQKMKDYKGVPDIKMKKKRLTEGNSYENRLLKNYFSKEMFTQELLLQA